MQTFLPFADFKQSAQSLDYRRLGKQRVETYQILKVLSGESKTGGWKNHPAVKMWKGHEQSLAEYGSIMSRTWLEKGYRDSLLSRFEEYKSLYAKQEMAMPAWLGNEEFHSSHRSNLLRKDFDFYSRHGWAESPDKEYIWPV